jgi:hypothetical protein
MFFWFKVTFEIYISNWFIKETCISAKIIRVIDLYFSNKILSGNKLLFTWIDFLITSIDWRINFMSTFFLSFGWGEVYN